MRGRLYIVPDDDGRRAISVDEAVALARAESLSDQEILLRAITASQAALARYVPGSCTAAETLNALLRILDREDVTDATLREHARVAMAAAVDC